jgi:acyl carrier protein
MTREQVAAALEQELSQLVNAPAGELARDRLLSQMVNSVGFAQLVAAMESRLGVTIEDEAIYGDAAPVTIGDLADFLFSLVAQRSPA